LYQRKGYLVNIYAVRERTALLIPVKGIRILSGTEQKLPYPPEPREQLCGRHRRRTVLRKTPAPNAIGSSRASSYKAFQRKPLHAGCVLGRGERYHPALGRPR
jgi:hypothetical protein